MLEPLYDPTALPRIVTWRSAQALGFSRDAIAHRVRTGRWRRVLPRTYLTADSLTERDRCDAALAFSGSGATLSGAAALRASGVRRIASPGRILVLTPPRNRTTSTEWVQVRRTFRAPEIERWLGPRRVVVARAAADHALTLSRLDDVRALVAQVISDGRCELDELTRELERGPRRGSAHLRTALTEVGASRSAPEVRAGTALRSAGLGGFEQNARIDRAGGGYFEADFLWRGLRAILEIDSIEFHLGPQQWRSTMDRHLELATLGFSVIHRPPSAVLDRARFVTDVGRWLASRRRELGQI